MDRNSLLAAGPTYTYLRGLLAVPIGAVFRGLLIGIAVLAAVFAARTLLGIGSADE